MSSHSHFCPGAKLKKIIIIIIITLIIVIIIIITTIILKIIINIIILWFIVWDCQNSSLTIKIQADIVFNPKITSRILLLYSQYRYNDVD